MFEHIATYYDLRVLVYTDVAKSVGAHVQHIADYMLERWWQTYAEAHHIEMLAEAEFIELCAAYNND